MTQVLISEVIAALQAELDKRGDVPIMQPVFAKPGELHEMTELPFVTRVNHDGEFVGIVMRLP